MLPLREMKPMTDVLCKHQIPYYLSVKATAKRAMRRATYRVRGKRLHDRHKCPWCLGNMLHSEAKRIEATRCTD